MLNWIVWNRTNYLHKNGFGGEGYIFGLYFGLRVYVGEFFHYATGVVYTYLTEWFVGAIDSEFAEFWEGS